MAIELPWRNRVADSSDSYIQEKYSYQAKPANCRNVMSKYSLYPTDMSLLEYNSI